MLAPDQYVRSIHDIDLEALRADGIDALMLDLDNTLLPRNNTRIPAELRAWLSRASAAGFTLRIVSNNWHSHVRVLAEDLGVGLVPRALKPLPFAFRRALREMNSDRKHGAIVGDQIFTDVLGGKLLGITTILVTPLSTNDLPHMVILRRLERLVLAGRRPLP